MRVRVFLKKRLNSMVWHGCKFPKRRFAICHTLAVSFEKLQLRFSFAERPTNRLRRMTAIFGMVGSVRDIVLCQSMGLCHDAIIITGLEEYPIEE